MNFEDYWATYESHSVADPGKMIAALREIAEKAFNAGRRSAIESSKAPPRATILETVRSAAAYARYREM